MNMEKIYIVGLKQVPNTDSNQVLRNILFTSYDKDKARIQFMSYILDKLYAIKDAKIKEFNNSSYTIIDKFYKSVYTLYEFELN